MALSAWAGEKPVKSVADRAVAVAAARKVLRLKMVPPGDRPISSVSVGIERKGRAGARICGVHRSFAVRRSRHREHWRPMARPPRAGGHSTRMSLVERGSRPPPPDHRRERGSPRRPSVGRRTLGLRWPYIDLDHELFHPQWQSFGTSLGGTAARTLMPATSGFTPSRRARRTARRGRTTSVGAPSRARKTARGACVSVLSTTTEGPSTAGPRPT